MESAIYRFVFGANIALMALLLGFIGWVAIAYIKRYRRETNPKLRYRYLHVILLGCATWYLIASAVYSLFETSYETGSDPTIFFFPIGWIVMLFGIWALFKANKE